MGQEGRAEPWNLVGQGADALLLPALSSVATLEEMRPLAGQLAARWRCVLADWAGFGAPVPAGDRLSPAVLDGGLDALLSKRVPPGALGIAAGHGAFYLLRAARRHPGRFRALVLIAPTWRGPLPTVTEGERPGLCRAVRALLEAPALGPVLYRLNFSRPVAGRMLRGHVYADPATVTPALLDAKVAVAHRPGGRMGTAAFVSGGLDPAASRAEALELLAGDLPPVVMLRPRTAPRRSAAEMDAIGRTGRVAVVEVPGALSPHEEHPEAVAAAIRDAMDRPAGCGADALRPDAGHDGRGAGPP